MPLNRKFLPYAVRLDTAAGVDAWINQIQSAQHNAGISVMEEGGSSEPDREFVAVRDRKPTLSLTTTDLTFLASCGLAGIFIEPDTGDPGLYAYGRLAPLGGLRDAIANSTHMRMHCTDGLLVPQSVSAQHNQAASLNLMLYGILGQNGGSNSVPFLFEKEQAILAGAGATQDIFTVGAVKYTSSGNRLVDSLQSITLNFGLDVVVEGSDGEVDPTHVFIRARRPTFEFTVKDGELMEDVGEDGLDCTSFAMYFQKVEANGLRIAKATEQHISIISTSGLLVQGSKSGQHNQSENNTFTFYPVLDTNLFTTSTSAAIPTS